MAGDIFEVIKAVREQREITGGRIHTVSQKVLDVFAIAHKQEAGATLSCGDIKKIFLEVEVPMGRPAITNALRALMDDALIVHTGKEIRSGVARNQVVPVYRLAVADD